MGKVVKRQDFLSFFKSNSLDVAAMQKHAKEVGRSDSVAKAIGSADLDGDGKISGADEGAALFKALDKFDHDGSFNSLSLQTKGLDALLAEAEKIARPTSGAPAMPCALTASGDTLSAMPAGSSALSGAQRLNRRYSGAGAVSFVPTHDGKAKAFQYTGGMNVDTDGGKSRLARSDRYYQSQTSMKWAGHKSLNADNIPYIVLPPSLAKATGAKLGDLVEVKKGGKSVYAVYGDVGPSMKLGEGLLALAQVFDKRAGPNIGIDGGVTYTVLPGSGAAAGIENGGPEKTSAEIQQAGAAAFAKARADGVLR